MLFTSIFSFSYNAFFYHPAIENITYATFELSSVFVFFLNQSEILSSGKEFQDSDIEC